jgi:phage terminase large subunit-like protein
MITSGIRARVQDYIEGVLNGDIVTSQRARDAVARHLADLGREGDADFPYYFDAGHAQQVCRFFPAMLRHSIGEFAGQPFELEDWQLFGVWVLFGWKRIGDNSRRFRKAYWSMARKNGKSSFAAGLCHYLAVGDIDPKTGKPEAVGQILLTATKKDQAKVIYSEAERMRNQSPTLKKMSGVKYETITYSHNQSYMRMVSSDKPFDGLNPHCVVMDELHAWGEHHRKFYDTMVTGSASRTQPLHLIITTAGDDQSHLWLEDYQYACQVVRGVVVDETLFALVYELDEEDNPADERNWIKANPNLHVSVKLDYLQQQWNECQHTAIKRNRFVRYHGNRVVTSTEKAFDLVAWDACAGELSDWTEADAIGAGADLGARDDLAGLGYCARFRIDSDSEKPQYRYEIKCKAFIASDTTRDLVKAPFSTWIYDEKLQKCTYPIDELSQQLIEDCREFDIPTVAYDPYNGQQLGESLTKEGITAARMAQNQANFNEAIRDFQDLIAKGRIKHDGNPLLRWCVNNAIIARDRQDRWMFDKRSSGEKIDPLVATVMAYRVASLAPERSTGKVFLI